MPTRSEGSQRAVRHLDAQNEFGHLEGTWAFRGHSKSTWRELKVLRHSST